MPATVDRMTPQQIRIAQVLRPMRWENEARLQSGMEALRNARTSTLVAVLENESCDCPQCRLNQAASNNVLIERLRSLRAQPNAPSAEDGSGSTSETEASASISTSSAVGTISEEDQVNISSASSWTSEAFRPRLAFDEGRSYSIGESLRLQMLRMSIGDEPQTATGPSPEQTASQPPEDSLMAYSPNRPKMVPVTREKPCAICGKPDWCLVAPDGCALICARPQGEANSVKRCGDAGWLHILDKDKAIAVAPGLLKEVPTARRTPEELSRIWSEIVSKSVGRNRTADISDQLDFHPGPLGDRVATMEDRLFFKESDAYGRMCGITIRYLDGRKKAVFGSRRGLFSNVSAWTNFLGQEVFMPEGATDCLAGQKFGLTCVGRPSNTSGVEIVAKFIENRGSASTVILGENDRKSDGEWPGYLGTIEFCRRLSARLNKPVKMAMPPGCHKDLRAAVTAGIGSRGSYIEEIVNSTFLIDKDGPMGTRGSLWQRVARNEPPATS